MKKIIIAIIFIMATSICYAQIDTTLITNSKITMETESYVNKKGQTKTDYWCLWNGEVYQSDKTTYRRYNAYKRYKANPQFALLTNKKSKAKRIIIL